MFKRFEHLSHVDSTNEYLKQYLEDGQPRFVVADEQTAGKGRFGRSWYSPRGQGLYVSYLLYPTWGSGRAEILNQIASLAVVHSIQEMGLPEDRVRVKPPNDVLIGGRKVSGILVELGSLGSRIEWAIVGIGVNLLQKDFGGEVLRTPATSLALEGVDLPHSMDFCDILTSHLERLFRDAVRGHVDRIRRRYCGLSIGEE